MAECKQGNATYTRFEMDWPLAVVCCHRCRRNGFSGPSGQPSLWFEGVAQNGNVTYFCGPCFSIPLAPEVVVRPGEESCVSMTYGMQLMRLALYTDDHGLRLQQMEQAFAILAAGENDNPKKIWVCDLLLELLTLLRRYNELTAVNLPHFQLFIKWLPFMTGWKWQDLLHCADDWSYHQVQMWTDAGLPWLSLSDSSGTDLATKCLLSQGDRSRITRQRKLMARIVAARIFARRLDPFVEPTNLKGADRQQKAEMCYATPSAFAYEWNTLRRHAYQLEAYDRTDFNRIVAAWDGLRDERKQCAANSLYLVLPVVLVTLCMDYHKEDEPFATNTRPARRPLGPIKRLRKWKSTAALTIKSRFSDTGEETAFLKEHANSNKVPVIVKAVMAFLFDPPVRVRSTSQKQSLKIKT